MQNYNKFVISLLAAAGVIASSNLLTGSAELWVNTCIAAVSAALVVWFPNIKTPVPPAEPFEAFPAPLAPVVSPGRPALTDDEPGPPEDDAPAVQ